MEPSLHQSQQRSNPAFDHIGKKTNSDLHAVHRGHMAWIAGHLNGEDQQVAANFAVKLMDGLNYLFDPTPFMNFAMAQYDGILPPPIAKQLITIQKLSLEFRGRVSVVVWEALACIAVQTVPSEQPDSIRGRKDLLLPWQEVDVVLHAIAKPYDFFQHLQSCFCSMGFLLSHFGECGCCIREARTDVIRCYLAERLKQPATEALMKHLHTEAITILVNELPHAASSGS